MCTYCGCHSIDSVGSLAEEHDASLGLLAHARRAVYRGDADEAVRLATELIKVIGPHTAVEEHVVFPVLVADYPEYVASLLDEHRRIDASLYDAATMTGQAALAALADAAETLRQHIRREEDGLYPAALSSLELEDWERAERVRHSVLARPRALAAARTFSGRSAI